MDSLFLRRPARSTFQPELRSSALPGIERQSPPQKHLWLWALLGLTAVRFLMAWIIPLSPEEAYHWNFARHLDWSYYSWQQTDQGRAFWPEASRDLFGYTFRPASADEALWAYAYDDVFAGIFWPPSQPS